MPNVSAAASANAFSAPHADGGQDPLILVMLDRACPRFVFLLTSVAIGWWRTAAARRECTNVYFCRPPAGPPMVAAVTGFPARRRLRPHGGSAPSRRYERRRPEKTSLHRVVSENLESWLERRDRAERPVPGYVEDELHGYLEKAKKAKERQKRQALVATTNGASPCCGRRRHAEPFVPATKSGQDRNLPIFGGWHHFRGTISAHGRRQSTEQDRPVFVHRKHGRPVDRQHIIDQDEPPSQLQPRDRHRCGEAGEIANDVGDCVGSGDQPTVTRRRPAKDLSSCSLGRRGRSDEHA